MHRELRLVRVLHYAYINRMLGCSRLAMCTAAAVALGVLAASGAAQDSTRQQRAASAARLIGVVRDSLGHGLPGVEVSILDRPEHSSTDSSGAFALVDVPPGRYEVWFRRIGFESSQFDWQAHAGEEVSVEAHLRLLPRTLDPVIVRAQEERSLSARSSIGGTVIDTAGVPVPNASIELLGTGRTTITLADGSFRFRHVPAGAVTLRARRLGFAPNVVRTELADRDDRGITLRLRQLPQTLDAVEIRERSGYGASELAWREYDARQRFDKSALSVFFGPDQLRRYGATSLDVVATTSDIAASGELARLRSPSVDIKGGATFGGGMPGLPDDACILENGSKARLAPLRSYSAKELEALEYYPPSPPETEVTRSVSARFMSIRQCAPSGSGDHPAYWVVWRKGASR